MCLSSPPKPPKPPPPPPPLPDIKPQKLQQPSGLAIAQKSAARQGVGQLVIPLNTVNIP